MPPPAEHALRIGVDAVRVDRLQQVIGEDGDRRRSVFTERELATCRGRREYERLAARFAAKEAVLKAFGTGLTRGMRFTDVEVVNARSGRPMVVLAGAAASFASRRGLREIDISLTHTAELAIATAVTAWGQDACAST